MAGWLVGDGMITGLCAVIYCMYIYIYMYFWVHFEQLSTLNSR